MPEYRAPWTGTTHHPGSALGRRAGTGLLHFNLVTTSIWSLFIWHNFLPLSIFPMCFSSLSAFTALSIATRWVWEGAWEAWAPPGEGGKEGKQLQVLLQALDRFCPTTGDRPSPGTPPEPENEEWPTSSSRLQEQRVALWLRGPKCCHALFGLRETCNMSEPLPLWCLGRSTQKAEANIRPRVTWGKEARGNMPYLVSFLITKTGALTVRSFLFSSQSLLLR